MENEMILEKLTSIDNTLQAIFVLAVICLIIYYSKKITNRFRGL